MKTFYYNVNAPKIKKLYDLKSDESFNLYCDDVILGFDNINYNKVDKKNYLLYKQTENADVYIDKDGNVLSSLNYNYGTVKVGNKIAYANVISSNERKIYISDGETSKVFSPTSSGYVTTAEVGTSACHHRGRLYVYKGNGRIVGSAPLDVVNNNSKSKVDFLTEEIYGPVYELLEYVGHVYAICKWGIFRFIEKGSSNIVVESVAKFNVSIREGTVAGVGQSIYFATLDAVVKVDGMNVTVVKSNIFNNGCEVQNLRAIGQNGKYYISGIFDGKPITYCFYDGRQENICLSDNFSIIPSSVISNKPCEEVVGYWKKKILDEDLKYKSLMKLSVNSVKPCVITISTKGQTKKFNVKDGVNLLNVNMTGRTFIIEITTPIYQQKISNVEVIYYDKEM